MQNCYDRMIFLVHITQQLTILQFNFELIIFDKHCPPKTMLGGGSLLFLDGFQFISFENILEIKWL